MKKNKKDGVMGLGRLLVTPSPYLPTTPSSPSFFSVKSVQSVDPSFHHPVFTTIVSYGPISSVPFPSVLSSVRVKINVPS